mmetsp:Transcript_28960/g.65622  ORF Transcript_28960/g.65622 Transcript_28960/m.65622 type:complete len:221 (+) Transcript_28960:131-793(+)
MSNLTATSARMLSMACLLLRSEIMLRWLCISRCAPCSQCSLCSSRPLWMRRLRASSWSWCCWRICSSLCAICMLCSLSSFIRSHFSSCSAFRLSLCASSYLPCFASDSTDVFIRSKSRENLYVRCSLLCIRSWNSANSCCCLRSACSSMSAACRSNSVMFWLHAELNSIACIICASCTPCCSFSCRLARLCSRRSSSRLFSASCADLAALARRKSFRSLA